MSNGNDMAFPTPPELAPNNSTQVGLTKREYFAAMAMQGLLSNLSALRRDGFADGDLEVFARMRADALLAELAKS